MNSSQSLREVIIKSVSVEEVRPLRHRILRPHQSFEESFYPLDSHTDTFHLAALEKNTIIGVATILHENPPGQSGMNTWRLRGMAVNETHQKRGVGSQLLTRAIADLQARQAFAFWCNARRSALNFYLKHHFKTQGPEFEIPGIGPHFLLVRHLG